jgi:hypothetical protein
LRSDSHQKQLFASLQCFLLDFYDGKECKVSADPAVVQQVNTLPVMPGQSKCIHLMGGTRICFVHVVMGTSLVNNPEVRYGATVAVGAACALRARRTVGAAPAPSQVCGGPVGSDGPSDSGSSPRRTSISHSAALACSP